MVEVLLRSDDGYHVIFVQFCFLSLVRRDVVPRDAISPSCRGQCEVLMSTLWLQPPSAVIMNASFKRGGGPSLGRSNKQCSTPHPLSPPFLLFFVATGKERSNPLPIPKENASRAWTWRPGTGLCQWRVFQFVNRCRFCCSPRQCLFVLVFMLIILPRVSIVYFLHEMSIHIERLPRSWDCVHRFYLLQSLCPRDLHWSAKSAT